MNIKHISRIMVLALTVSAAGSAVAIDPNSRTAQALNWANAHKWQIAGVGSAVAVATALAIWQHAHVKKVKAEEAKKKAEEAAKRQLEEERKVRAQRQAQRQVRRSTNRVKSIRRVSCAGNKCHR